jgi:hypothetical protein
MLIGLSTLICGISTIVVLFVRSPGDSTAPDTVTLGVKRILAVYLPLLGIMTGFYFADAERRDDRARETTVEIFWFSMLLTLPWVLTPLLLVALSSTMDRALELMDTFGPVGQLVASGAVAYYFSKTRPAHPDSKSAP